ncbi:MAG: hypothetical protein HFF62_03435 [Oscillospiraceae bacterium]|jgi:YbbR domain-containing protein|nr:hypothetical protein [Oscillospiraceae bacterium]
MSEKGNRIVYLALSLLLAIAFWLYVDDWLGSTTTKELTGIPVEFIGAEDTLPSRGLMLTEGEDTTMDVKLSGPRTVISGLDKNDLIIQVNLTNVTAVGTFSYPWTWDVVIAGNLRDKSGISLEKASLSTVTFQVSPLYSKQVPVSVNVNGEVADGHIYMAERLAADPSVLTLSGKEEDVDQVESARIAVDLTDANATLQREFAYELLDADGNVVENDKIRVSDRRVLVTAPVYIVKDLALKVKFKESPGSKEENIRWDLEYDTITVAGEPASLENVSEILLDEIDLSKVLSDDGLEPLEIGIPAGCVNLSGFTTTKISIRFRGLDTRTFTATNITAVNISEGQIFSKMTNSVDVMLRGPASELDQVTPEDIRIVVDLAEFYSNGTFSSPAIVLVDGHDQVGAVGEPCTVAFKITS